MTKDYTVCTLSDLFCTYLLHQYTNVSIIHLHIILGSI